MKQTYVMFVAVLLLYSCKQPSKPRLSEAYPISADTVASSSCPFLSKDNNGNIIISWVKEINDTTAVLCYSVIDNDGNRSPAVEIPASKGLHPHGENMPKMSRKADGTWIAIWGIANPNSNNKYSGLVSYAVSRNGKDWSKAVPLVSDTGSYDQRYFDIGLLPSGEVAVIWLDSRYKKGKEGSTLFYASTDSSDRFVGEKPIAETCCPCCRTDLLVDTKGNIHAAFRDIIDDSIRDMVHIVSENGGKSFSTPARISIDNWAVSGCPHTGPTMAENSRGLHFAWYTMGTGNGVFYNHSENRGETFSLKEIVSAESSAKHPQIMTANNDDLIIAWDQVAKHNEDYNSIILVQHRLPDGKLLSQDSVTKTTDVATFPVLAVSGKGDILIAYTLQNGDKKRVYYNRYSYGR